MIVKSCNLELNNTVLSVEVHLHLDGITFDNFCPIFFSII